MDDKNQNSLEKMLIIDVGSTTTKVLFFLKKEEGWRLINRGEAATTVEAPNEDVMIGVLQAIERVADRVNLSLLEYQDNSYSIKVDHLLATSSAGGGLQMVVCGNVGRISGESAQRAALGGGAILLDVFSPDDSRDYFQRLERLRSLRPDMILLSGGVEGAEVIRFMVEMCDFIRTAKPRPKFGYAHDLPVIYAGSSTAIPLVKDLLAEGFVVKFVDNLRPSFEEENLEPAREAIHELFIEHVMSNAPGYGRLQEATSLPLLPTPTAVGEILVRYASKRRVNLLCVDIGGATTDVFSVVNGNYMRSVSANFGMSYSIGNVINQAGEENIVRWLPEEQEADQLKWRLATKLLYPISIPATIEDLFAEQAAAREALRLSYLDHIAIAKVQKPKGLFETGLLVDKQEIDIAQIDLIIGSGGVLCNAPDRGQAALMLLDAFQPVGVTQLMVDSVFMLPHLGAFTHLDEAASLYALENDCLIPLGTALVPQGQPLLNASLSLTGQTASGKKISATVQAGDLVSIELLEQDTAEITVSVTGGFTWPGQHKLTIRGGLCGIIIDLRGRPLKPSRYKTEWMTALATKEFKE